MQEIYIEDTGTGYPLVLVHGFLGSSEMWEPQINYLSKYYRVITPNLPGFGKSKNVKSLDSINLMAKSIIDWLNKKKIEKFYLLGHSMGGMIAQEITTQLGSRITKLICYGTGPIGDIPGRFETMDESREKLKKNGLEVTAYRIAKTWFVEEDKSKYFYLCDNAGKATSAEAVDNALIAMKNWNGIENLKKIKNKTLIIWGDQDKAYNFNQVDTLNKNIPNSDIVILKGCSHNVHLEVPEKFNEIVKNFIENQ
jgi:pimeloyl-ACP methyl ester carboxylesterase|tara:strand:+ start:16 stop:774 length:759 start_codon:yes stop_codon:yes gene_type:complete